MLRILKICKHPVRQDRVFAYSGQLDCHPRLSREFSTGDTSSAVDQVKEDSTLSKSVTSITSPSDA